MSHNSNYNVFFSSLHTIKEQTEITLFSVTYKLTCYYLIYLYVKHGPHDANLQNCIRDNALYAYILEIVSFLC